MEKGTLASRPAVARDIWSLWVTERDETPPRLSGCNEVELVSDSLKEFRCMAWLMKNGIRYLETFTHAQDARLVGS
jgi:hypothetical protein